MTGPDPRLTLARDGLASADLEGIAPAGRYAQTTPLRVITPNTPLRAAPSPRAGQVDQLLFGEIFDRLETREDYAFGRARRDGYVGYVRADTLSGDLIAPTHWIAAIRTFAFEDPSIKSAARGPVSLNALVAIEAETPSLALAHGLGWIARDHLRPIGEVFGDPADVALRFLGAPYLWGGRDSLGLDCSGLVQQALYACGLACPRDSDQQAGLGRPAPSLSLRRGDLVFWRGHVGMMLDPRRILHANGHHMAVAIEPLASAEARIVAAGGGPPTAFRRL